MKPRRKRWTQRQSLSEDETQIRRQEEGWSSPLASAANGAKKTLAHNTKLQSLLLSVLMESRAGGDVFYQKSLPAKKKKNGFLTISKCFSDTFWFHWIFWCLSSLPNSKKLKIEWNALKEAFLFCSWEQLFKSILKKKKGKTCSQLGAFLTETKYMQPSHNQTSQLAKVIFFQTVNLPKYRKKYSFPLQSNFENTDVLVFFVSALH